MYKKESNLLQGNNLPFFYIDVKCIHLLVKKSKEKGNIKETLNFVAWKICTRN